MIPRLLLIHAAALVDLNNALNLSGGTGRSACQALCQRALLHMKDGQEEQARHDLESAAKMGSGFAKAQVNKFIYLQF